MTLGRLSVFSSLTLFGSEGIGNVYGKHASIKSLEFFRFVGSDLVLVVRWARYISLEEHRAWWIITLIKIILRVVDVLVTTMSVCASKRVHIARTSPC